jgi:membrane-associated HD superfamily phosphohydrolase
MATQQSGSNPTEKYWQIPTNNIMDKNEPNKRTVQAWICVCYLEPENAHTERLKTFVPDQCKAVLMECTFSSTYVTKTDLGEGILSLLAYFSLMHLLNSQLKQQNVFFIVPSLSTIVNASTCVRKLKRSQSVITASLLLTALLVTHLLVFHSVECGLLHTTVMTHSHLPLQLSIHTNEGQ